MSNRKQLNLGFYLLLILTISISGCNQHSLHGQFETYEERLTQLLEDRAEALKQPVIYPTNITPQANPIALSPSALPEQQTISLSELNALTFCGLGELIAQHNSQLGKLAQPSQRFVYELTLIQRIYQCDITQLNEEQKTLLVSLEQRKVPQLHQHWNHFVTHSAALTRHFSAGSSNVGFPVERLQQQYFALASLVKLQNYVHAISDLPEGGKPPKHNGATKLETHLSELDKPQLGNAIRAVHYSIARLNYLNTLLTANSALVACQAKRSNQHQEILNNIFQHYYVKQIQPNLSLLIQDLQGIQPLVMELYQSQPPAFLDHYSEEGKNNQSIFQEITAAFKQHAKWWVELRKECNTATDLIQ